MDEENCETRSSTGQSHESLELKRAGCVQLLVEPISFRDWCLLPQRSSMRRSCTWRNPWRNSKRKLRMLFGVSSWKMTKGSKRRTQKTIGVLARDSATSSFTERRNVLSANSTSSSTYWKTYKAISWRARSTRRKIGWRCCESRITKNTCAPSLENSK